MQPPYQRRLACVYSQLHSRQLGNRLKSAFFSTFRFSICDCATKRDQMATKLGNQLEQYVLSMLGQVLGTFRLYVRCAGLETEMFTFRALAWAIDIGRTSKFQDSQITCPYTSSMNCISNRLKLRSQFIFDEKISKNFPINLRKFPCHLANIHGTCSRLVKTALVNCYWLSRLCRPRTRGFASAVHRIVRNNSDLLVIRRQNLQC